ncbi:hypothetical protein HYX14_02725 [Candidatus Woesearchaeota archaeon]|nr:hypothetical protein [Candidatus Woesearchaeota archaeon]
MARSQRTVQRPTGVTVFAVLEIIFTVMSFLFWIFVALVSAIVQLVPEAKQMMGAALAEAEVSIAYLAVTAVVSVMVSVAGFIAAMGALKLRVWGRKMMMVVAGFSILYGIVNQVAFNQIETGFFFLLPGLVYNGLILWYFNRKDVKAVFS